MQLGYGSYLCQANEVAVTLLRDLMFENGIATKVNEVWNLRGRTHAADQASLTTALAALEAAFLIQGQDLIFYLNSGSVSAHALYSNQCLGGTRVTSPVHYLEGAGAQYTTYRDWTATVEGTKLMSNVNIVDFGEFVEYTGGGPEFGFFEPIDSPPRLQKLKQFTTYKAVQQGFATGLRSHPQPPPPLFPLAEHKNRRRIRPETPERLGAPGRAQYMNFRISWYYEFEQAQPFPLIQPSLWPV